MKTLYIRILCCIYLCLLISCSTRLVPKEKSKEFNDSISDRIYILKEEIKSANNEILKKGSFVKLYIESTPSLLKVKCIPANESREYAIGRMAIYKINDDYEQRELNFDEIESIIAEKFDIYDPSKKPKRK
ncbi:MAG: type II secretion system-associated lipoprotein [Leptospiraceae bacterium]|nr:type II secretion system-associated lipoprotein [Leptospiraceae bacterium]